LEQLGVTIRRLKDKGAGCLETRRRALGAKVSPDDWRDDRLLDLQRRKILVRDRAPLRYRPAKTGKCRNIIGWGENMLFAPLHGASFAAEEIDPLTKSRIDQLKNQFIATSRRMVVADQQRRGREVQFCRVVEYDKVNIIWRSLWLTGGLSQTPCPGAGDNKIGESAIAQFTQDRR